MLKKSDLFLEEIGFFIPLKKGEKTKSDLVVFK